MNILCVIDSLGSGGAQRQLVGLAIGFKEKGHDVSFLIYHVDDFFKSKLDAVSIPVHIIKEPNYFLRLIKMRKFIRKGNYDSVLSFLEAPNFICEIAGFPMRKWKLVVGERNANAEILKSFKLKFFRLFHLFADYIVANSQANLQIVLKANPFLIKNRCSVIYNLIDLQEWKPTIHKYRINGKLKLVVVASQIFRKNLIGLVNAINLLESKHKDKIEITWYGDKISKPYIDNSFIEAKNKIISKNIEHLINFQPATSNIKQKIHEADAIGLFSFNEGIPNVLIEAMAIGKPIVASNISDIPILIDNVKLLCDPIDTYSIKNALTYLLSLSEDELDDIGRNNRLNVTKLFNYEDTIDGYLKVLI